MRPALLVLVLGTVACDDAEVADAALSLLSDGVVAARIACTGMPLDDNSGGQCWSTRTMRYSASKLADGSCMATGGIDIVTSWVARSEIGAESCSVMSPDDLSASLASPSAPGWLTTYVEGGFVKFTYADADSALTPVGGCSYSNPQALDSFAITTYCTGFNFEAFGVEP